MITTTVIDSVRSLLPTIRARRQDIEEARRLPADLAKALRETGIFSLGVPRAIGGQEATPAEMMEAIETVATADGSAGWCAMIGMSGAPQRGTSRARRKRGVAIRPLRRGHRRAAGLPS